MTDIYSAAPIEDSNMEREVEYCNCGAHLPGVSREEMVNCYNNWAINQHVTESQVSYV